MKPYQLFVKHFGDTFQVDENHPGIAPFLDELNQITLQKAIEQGSNYIARCPFCKKLFILTGKEQYFAADAQNKEKAPICPPCIITNDWINKVPY